MVIIATPEKIESLHSQTEIIRNICIIAHVDHGKTTLSDSLISSNGIISERLAGKLRYLDSTEEEQQRGITMQSSAISLLYEAQGNNVQNETIDSYLINLVDSPGHVDFSSDVSSAVRLCDGALLLVDVVEGVCAQTRAVLRQAWKERVRPCLVLNKMDRLILELQLTPYEAYQHICRILEQVNAILSSMITSDALALSDKEISNSPDETRSKEQVFMDWQLNVDEDEESKHFFSPNSGNVVFASAFDCWAFGIGYFAHVYSKKLDIPVQKLRHALWGDYYYNPKMKKIVKKPPTTSSVPMFVQMVLEPIWSVYSAVVLTPDQDRVVQILKSLRILQHIPERERQHSDRRIALQSIMRRWLPLSNSVLRMVVRFLPCPITAQTSRLNSLFPTLHKNRRLSCGNSEDDSLIQMESQKLRASVGKCADGDDTPLVVFVSKVVSADRSMFSDNLGSFEGNDCLVGIARVYSGTLSPEKTLYVLGPKYEPTLETDQPRKHLMVIPQNSLGLYMIMGREYRKLSKVNAGNIVGITGLDEFVLKTATISSTPLCPSLTAMPFQAVPVVRVAVEPEDPRNLNDMKNGLQKLYRSDPTVEVMIQESGEHIIMALGELHLERCVKDLRERFAKVPIRVSAPIVGFRETITNGSISNAQQSVLLKQYTGEDEKLIMEGKSFAVRLSTPNKMCTFTISALPLPNSVSQFLEREIDLIRAVVTSSDSVFCDEANEEMDQAKESDKGKLSNMFQNLLQSEGDPWKSLKMEDIWAFGPRRCGSNILINEIPNFKPATVFNDSKVDATSEVAGVESLLQRISNSITTGFQLATAAGPLCEEPIWGVAFTLENLDITELDKFEKKGHDVMEKDVFGPLSGQVISTVKTACRHALLQRPVRVVEALYSCTVQCQAEQLGKLFGVLARRRGQVVEQELSDTGTWFVVKSLLPVVESFGFSDELLSHTSGGATTPQMEFSHWALLDIDPYFQPTTEEEREEHGERIHESNNIVRKYIDAIRKRKGLVLEEKIVVHAEKQRTLTRNK